MIVYILVIDLCFNVGNTDCRTISYPASFRSRDLCNAITEKKLQAFLKAQKIGPYFSRSVECTQAINPPKGVL